MAAIEVRRNADGTVAYRVRIRLRGCAPASASFRRKTDAQRWVQSTEAAIREGRYFRTAAARRHTIAQLLERYEREILPRKSADSRNQRRQLAWWKSKIGYQPLSELSPALISECREMLAREPITPKCKKPNGKTQPRFRQAATLNRYLAVLSHACSLAEREWGLLEQNPVRRVRKHKEPQGRTRFLSDEEREALLGACRTSKHPHLYTIVVLALSTGMRLGEIMGLRWPQVDLERGKIVLHRTKNSHVRNVPVTGRALELLRTLHAGRGNASDLLFPSRRKPDKPIALKPAWQNALRRARIATFRFHDLRHSAASYLAMSGASAPEIAAVLGHRTLQMVQRYAHLSDPHTRGVVENMNRRMFPHG